MLRPNSVIAFVFLSTSVAIDTSPSLAAPAGYVNVQTFGAKGDGKTDDTSAITSALAATPPGSGIYFPSGTYLYSEELFINKSKTVLGLNATLLSGSSTAFLNISADATTVSGLTFSTKSGTAVPYAIFSIGVANLTITNNTFAGSFSSALALSNSTAGVIQNNTINSYYPGVQINLQNCLSPSVLKNTVTAPIVFGGSNTFIVANKCQKVSISSNTLSGGQYSAREINSTGIASSNNNGVKISGNKVSGLSLGISSVGDINNSITANLLSNLDTGVNGSRSANGFFGSTPGLSINSNTIANCGNGITGDHLFAPKISQNNIQNIQAGVINVQAMWFTVDGNIIKNVGLNQYSKPTQAVISVTQPYGMQIIEESIKNNSYQGNSIGISDFIFTDYFPDSYAATVSGNVTNTLLPTVIQIVE